MYPETYGRSLPNNGQDAIVLGSHNQSCLALCVLKDNRDSGGKNQTKSSQMGPPFNMTDNTCSRPKDASMPTLKAR